MEVIHKFTLDVDRQGVQAVIPMTRGDGSSHRLMVTFTQSGRHVAIEDGSRAALYCRKPDDTEVLCSGICYSRAGAYPDTVAVTVSNRVTELSGTVNARLVISLGSVILYSPVFAFRIDENEFADSDYSSQSDYSALVNLVLESESCAADAEAWATGEIGGEPVSSDDPRYHNNSKYYAENHVCDSEMSDQSQNAVQNRVVKAYVDGAIQSAIQSAIVSALNTSV